METQLRRAWPAFLSLAVALAYVIWRLTMAGWDPAALAEIGERYAFGDPAGSQGYDGQFAYYMAVDPRPQSVATRLDVPAYRYQRVLYPMLARALALGRTDRIAWSLIVVNLASLFLGTLAVGEVMVSYGQRPGHALVYGLWVGLVAAVGVDLHEPLAYALVAGAWLVWVRDRPLTAALLAGLALFAKETTVLFWGALLLEALFSRRSSRAAAALTAGGVAFALWQLWLWRTFGRPGIGSGGAMSTPFEWIPLMGLLRVGQVSTKVLAVFLAAFGPTVVLPALWGTAAGIRDLWRGRGDAASWALLANAGAVLFLPFSTFREPLGLLRFATGLVLATLIYAAARNARRPLAYSWFWIALSALLLNG